jgi:hypothetical protein
MAFDCRQNRTLATMTAEAEFEIRLVYDQRPDGRFYIHSPNVPGLHLSGISLGALTTDIEPLIRDLLLYNSKVIVDSIRWVPPLEEMIEKFRHPAASPPAPSPGESRVLVITGRAA